LNLPVALVKFGADPAPGPLDGVILEDNELSLAHMGDAIAPATGPDMSGADMTDSDRLLALILKSLDDDKAEDIVQIDLRGRSEMGDWMVIATGRSSRQVTSIAEKLTDKVKAEMGVLSKVEGRDTGDWVLIDTGDVVVHVFRPEVREFYQLEKMWMSPEQASERS
jgi:ribosome-associated protein